MSAGPTRPGATLIYPVPTPASRPRRGHMTADGRLAFAEFAADKIGVFDTKTEQIQEFPTTPFLRPMTRCSTAMANCGPAA